LYNHIQHIHRIMSVFRGGAFGGTAVHGTPSCLEDSLWCSDPSIEITIPRPMPAEREALDFSCGLYRFDHVCHVFEITMMHDFTIWASSFINFIHHRAHQTPAGRVFWFNGELVLFQEIGGDESWWIAPDLDSEYVLYAVPRLPADRLPPSTGRLLLHKRLFFGHWVVCFWCRCIMRLDILLQGWYPSLIFGSQGLFLSSSHTMDSNIVNKLWVTWW
jgi:hypothetical protein